MRTKNFGRKSLDDIRQILANIGLSLGVRIFGFVFWTVSPGVRIFAFFRKLWERTLISNSLTERFRIPLKLI